ncbi:MAG: hypothetical protein ACLFVP_00975 [Candidatus Bathyarchaeia archaeon]
MRTRMSLKIKRVSLLGTSMGTHGHILLKTSPIRGPLTGKELDEFKRLYFKRMMELDDRLDELLEE